VVQAMALRQAQRNSDQVSFGDLERSTAVYRSPNIGEDFQLEMFVGRSGAVRDK
jgi:hypothetical protein